MICYYLNKLADALDAEAQSREDTVRTLHVTDPVAAQIAGVEPALTVAATLRAVAAAIRKVCAS